MSLITFPALLATGCSGGTDDAATAGSNPWGACLPTRAGTTEERPAGASGGGFFRVSLFPVGASLNGEWTTIAGRFSSYASYPYCSRVTYGDCSVVKCPSPPGAGEMHPSGGTLSLTAGEKRLDAMPGPSGEYAGGAQGAVFAPGDLITASMPGGAVPGFSVAVRAPAGGALTSPQPGTTATLAACTPLTVSWQPVPDGRATIHLSGDQATVECQSPAASGSFTVPAEALALALVGEDPRATVSVQISNEAEVDAAGWRTTVIASAEEGSFLVRTAR